MRYDLAPITGNARTYAPVMPARTIAKDGDGRKLAATMHRTDEDSYSFRHHRALMHQTTGPCG